MKPVRVQLSRNLLANPLSYHGPQSLCESMHALLQKECKVLGVDFKAISSIYQELCALRAVGGHARRQEV